MKIRDSNWWTAAAAAALCLVLIVAIAILSANPANDTMLKRPSTFFTDSSGARAILLVLQRVLPSAEQWRLPITELRPPSRQGVTTLIAMNPNAFGQEEAGALDQWLAAGGQLILAADTDWRVQKIRDDRTTKDFLARHDISTARAERERPPAINAVNAISAGNAVTSAVIKDVGRGRIVYVPDSYAFSNGAMRNTDNAVWLTDRCVEWGGGVLFDEYHQGFGAQRGLGSIIAIFAATPWGLVFVQLAFAGAVYLFGCKRRFGRALEELPLERTNPIETVQAVGGLLQSAQARALAARTMHQYLNTQVSSVVGYRIDLLDVHARERLAGPLRIERAELDAYAAAAATAISSRTMSDGQLTRFGQQATAIARSFSHGSARNKHSAAAG